MRLVNTSTIQLEFFNDEESPRYAILSHTWAQEEILFHDIGLESAKLKKGYAKLESCCRVALENGHDYIWDDTCCIDKSSSAELSEAINSMYRYYQQASICYVYLADVSTATEIPNSRWFTRGWTLQELIAPSDIVFFNRQWQALGTKRSLKQVLSNVTRIPPYILLNSEELDKASIAQRMSWAADRVTTRKEDNAYCLMGIFRINMPLLYGEGGKAFYRLQEEIMRVSDDHSLFAWVQHLAPRGLLAPSPAAFHGAGNIVPWNPFAPYNRPFTITNKGIHIEAPFIARSVSGCGILVLCCKTTYSEDKLLGIRVRDLYLTMEHFERCTTDEIESVNLNSFSLAETPVRSLCLVPGKGLKGTTSCDCSLRDSETGDSVTEAALKGDAGAVWFLLSRATGGIRMFAREDIRLAICLAAKSGHERLLSQLMTRRDTADLVSMEEEDRTLLFYAAEGGHEGTLKLILSSSQILPDSKDSDGLTALWYALHHGHGDCAKVLLKTGRVSGNVGGEGHIKSALWLATEMGDIELVQLLVRRNAIINSTSEPPLHVAVASGNMAIAKYLLTFLADPNKLDAEGNTPLQLAYRDGNRDMASLLIAYGAVSDEMDSSDCL